MRLNSINWPNLLFFSLTPISAIVLVPLYHQFYDFNWKIIALAVVLASLASLSITAGYHRFLAHRSYATKPWLKIFYMFFGAAAFEGSALLWCTDHRIHHRHVDTDKDPYNIRKGFFYAHIGWILEHSKIDYASAFPKDLVEDRIVMWQHRNYLPLAIGMTFGFPTLIGYFLGCPVGGLIYGGIVRVIFNQHSTFLINSFCHMFGKQTYGNRNSARDSWWVAILTFGEGYHNFHHHFQSHYRNGIRWYDWDPTKWFINLMSYLGASYRLNVVPRAQILKARMTMEYNTLVSRGVPQDRLAALRGKVEEAQKRFHELVQDYNDLRLSVSENSIRRLIHLKAELKIARLEFRASIKQWVTYTRTFQALPSV